MCINKKAQPRLGKGESKDYFLRAISFFMHLPMALHLAGLGQPGQVLKADFFAPPVFALPYIMVNLLTICV
jgi:hypothetical protein